MRNSLTIIGFVAGLSIATGAVALDIITPAEVPEGARGVCVTEMDGGRLVEIPLEVLGTVGPSTPEGEMLLVRLEGERYEQTGIIAGMSGSPVYVDGRLLGALAFGWSFSKEPIGGVTPFTRMRAIGRSGGASPPTSAGLATRPDLERLLAASTDGSLGRTVVNWLLPEARRGDGLVPLELPVAGRPPAGGWLEDGFSRLGWSAAPAGASGGAATAGDPSAIVPGAMVAGVLVDGDATLAAGGTVTAVEGDRVWAFGHPFLGGGNVDLPLARARVISVLPSQLNSFKFFGVGPTLGAFRADRSHGIWGRLGPSPSLVPVKVSVEGQDYTFSALRDPTLTPLLVAYLTASSQAVHGRTFGGQTVTLRASVDYGAGTSVRLAETFVGTDAPARAAALVSALMAYLEATPFVHPELASVDVELATTETLELGEIVEIVPERRRVRAGDDVRARVRIRPRGEPDRWATVQVRVPDQTSPGRLDLVVADGASWTAYDLRMRPQRPASFADEVALIARIEPSTRLVAALERRDPVLVTGKGVVPVPAGVLVHIAGGLGSSMTTTGWGLVARGHLDLGLPVSGADRIRLEVLPPGRDPAPVEAR
jgi:hypothetical protein